MLRRLKNIFNNKGTSLVELIVSFGIMSILLTIIFMICQLTFSTIETNRHDTHADIMLDNLADYIKNTTGKTVGDLEVYRLPDDVSLYSHAAFADGCYALAFIDGRLYDLGEVAGQDWNAVKSDPEFPEKFRAFNDEYYNRTEAVINYKKFSGNGRWAEITLCAHREGNRITRNRIINYSLLNEETRIYLYEYDDVSGAHTEADTLEMIDPSGAVETKNILILYYK